MDNIFNPGVAAPFAQGLAENLKPNPPAAMPKAPGIPSAAPPSPFKQALDIDEIIKNLVLNRPLTLYIPPETLQKFSDYEFRIINSIPKEIAAANNKGFRQVDDPEVTGLFADLVAGHDEERRVVRPLLFARPRRVGNHVRNQQRRMLASVYGGLDPGQKNMGEHSKYTESVGPQGGTKGQFSGPAFKIRLGPEG